MKKATDPLAGFLIPADAIVPCACGATEGQPCRVRPRDKETLRPGYVHFGRRIRRLLLTAGKPEKREEFERKAVVMLHEYLAGNP